MGLENISRHFQNGPSSAPLKTLVGGHRGVLCYGWTGAQQRNLAFDRTDDLLEVCMVEFKMQPYGLTAVSGDVNGGSDGFPTMRMMLPENGWTDLGACFEIWGGTSHQITCRVSAGAKPTRQDHFLVSGLWLPAIKAFDFDSCD